jgi:hypothetical protein
VWRSSSERVRECDKRLTKGGARSWSPESGLSVRSAFGTDETWQRILAGKSGIAPISLFVTDNYPCRFAGAHSACCVLAQSLRRSRCHFRRSPHSLSPAGQTPPGEGLCSGGLRRAKRCKENGPLHPICHGGSSLYYHSGCNSGHAKGPDRVSPFFITSSIVNLGETRAVSGILFA